MTSSLVTPGLNPQRKSAGMVKIRPDAWLDDADPTVWEMLCSRMVERPQTPCSARKTATVITAIGIEVETVSPTRRPR